MTVTAALLMVSRLRYFSFKGAGPRHDRVPFLAIIVVLAVAAGIMSVAVRWNDKRKGGDW